MWRLLLMDWVIMSELELGCQDGLVKFREVVGGGAG